MYEQRDDDDVTQCGHSGSVPSGAASLWSLVCDNDSSKLQSFLFWENITVPSSWRQPVTMLIIKCSLVIPPSLGLPLVSGLGPAVNITAGEPSHHLMLIANSEL